MKTLIFEILGEITLNLKMTDKFSTFIRIWKILEEINFPKKKRSRY